MPEQTPESSADPTASSDRGYWQRAWDAVLARPTRGQFVVAALVALLGFAAAIQVRLTDTDEDFSASRREELIQLLDSLSGAADRTQVEINELRSSRDELRFSSTRRAEALQQSRSQLTALGILSGTLPATGPGISVQIEDPEGSMTAAVLLDGIEELRDAGAESIEFNDSVRVVASTALTERDGVVYVDDVALRPPYVIDAIGSSHTLSEAVIFPGGLNEQVAQLGGTVTVDERDVVEVASLHTIKPPQYSQPSG